MNKLCILLRKYSVFCLLLITFIFSNNSVAFAQNKVNGTVVDKTGEPLIGVYVLEVGTNNGTTTDIDGKFTLSVKKGKTIQFSFIGYDKKVLVVNSNVLNVVLQKDSELLDAVVVVGYGAMKKNDFTGSLTTVSNKKLTSAGTNMAGAALQGQIAGVDIQKSSNSPGSGFNIMIRGQNHISNSINDINEPLYVVDGMFVSNINDIAPEDIERIDVLKDASSTAIYGSRGANGVIIVTTKHGLHETSHVEYSGSISASNATNLPDMCDANEYAQYVKDYYEGKYWNDSSYQVDMESALGTNKYNNWKNGVNTDWEDLILKTGVSTRHNLRVYGNGKGLNYTFGIGYDNEQGVIDNNNYTRYNVSASITKKVSNTLKFGSNIYIADAIQEKSSYEAFRQAYRNNPLTLPYDDNGNLILYPDTDSGTVAANPLCEINNQSNEGKTLHVFGNLFAEYKPIKWLILKTTFNPDLSSYNYGEYRGHMTKSAKGGYDQTRAVITNQDITKYTWDNLVTADKTFEDHHTVFMVGSSWYFEKSEYSTMRGDGYSTDHYDWYNLGSGTINSSSTGSSYSQEQLMSFFSRLNYDYKGRYLLTLTGRYDGSSKLADGHRWAFFPSAALGWRITQEPFMKNVKFVDNLKLRVSYGISGNDHSVGAYQSQQTVGNSWYYFGNSGQRTAYLGGFENKSLSWEKTKEVNVGLDYDLLDGRLSGTLDIYNRTTDGIIMARTMSNLNGYGSVTDNVGKVRNSGVEIGLKTINVKTKDFTWSTNFTFSANKNEILALASGEDSDEGNGWFVGKSIGEIWTFEGDGIWQEDEAEEAAKYGQVPGAIKVKDVNGDYALTNEDKVFRGGSKFPQWTGGMTNTFKYKNLDLSVFVYTRQGQYSFCEFYSNLYMNDHLGFNIFSGLNYWTPNNTSGTTYRPGISHRWEETRTYQVAETSYTKVKNITLGYTMPDKISKKLRLSKMRVYATVLNPFVFDGDYLGPDPETANENSYTQYWMTRTWTFGVNLTF